MNNIEKANIPIGTIREWGKNKKWIKVGEGKWELYSEQQQAEQQEEIEFPQEDKSTYINNLSSLHMLKDHARQYYSPKEAYNLAKIDSSLNKFRLENTHLRVNYEIKQKESKDKNLSWDLVINSINLAKMVKHESMSYFQYKSKMRTFANQIRNEMVDSKGAKIIKEPVWSLNGWTINFNVNS